MSDEVDLRVALELARKDAADAKAEAKELRDWLTAIEQRSGLMSDSVVSRAFTVWGYYLLATIIISIPVAIVTAVLLSSAFARSAPLESVPVSVPTVSPSRAMTVSAPTVERLNEFGSADVTECISIVSKRGLIATTGSMKVSGTVKNVCHDTIVNVRLVVETWTKDKRVVSTVNGRIDANRLAYQESSAFEMAVNEQRNQSVEFTVRVYHAEWGDR